MQAYLSSALVSAKNLFRSWNLLFQCFWRFGLLFVFHYDVSQMRQRIPRRTECIFIIWNCIGVERVELVTFPPVVFLLTIPGLSLCYDLSFLAHLSYAQDELLWSLFVRRPSVRACVRPSVNIFKRLLLWSRWDNFALISYGASF